MHRNALPITLVVGGTFAAIYLGIQAIQLFISGDLAGEAPIAFSIACLVAVIGWNELRASQQFDESD